MNEGDQKSDVTGLKGLDYLTDDLGDIDPFDDHVLKSIIRECRSGCKAKRNKLARDWFRAELFYNGNQWVTYDAQLKRWRESGLKKHIPRRMTNTYASYCDIFASLVASVPLETTYRPLHEGEELDQQRTEIANDLTEAIQQQVKYKQRQLQAAPMLARHGEVFLIPYLRQEVFEEKDQQEEEKETTDELDEILSKDDALSPDPKLNMPPVEEIGRKIFQLNQAQPKQEAEPTGEDPDMPTGGVPELFLDVASAFECYMDEEADSCEDSSWFLRERSYDISKLKTIFPEIADKISPQKNISGDVSRYYAGSLSKLTSGQLGDGGYFADQGKDSRSRGELTQFFHEPTKNYPKGIYVLKVNDEIAVKGHLLYHDHNGRYFKNVVQIRAKKRTRNPHGRTPLDDAIQKQIQRNQLESFIELAITRMAAPHWVAPNGCLTSQVTGEPGTVISYKRVAASQTTVLKPEMVSGVSPPPAVFQWLAKIDEDTEYILGITKVLLGQLPPGTPAARALELLLDRARARHGDLFFEWNAQWAEVMNMFLQIVRVTKPVDLFKSVKKDFGGLQVRRFSEEDYDLRLEIIPETEQPAPPRSTLSELDLIETFTTMGLFQAPPDLQNKVLKRFGLSYLNKDFDREIRFIEREHYRMIHYNELPVMRLFDLHPLHYEKHRQFTMTDEYIEWKEENPEMAMQFEMEHLLGHQSVGMMLSNPGAPQEGQVPEEKPPEGPPTGAESPPSGEPPVTV